MCQKDADHTRLKQSCLYGRQLMRQMKYNLDNLRGICQTHELNIQSSFTEKCETVTITIS